MGEIALVYMLGGLSSRFGGKAKAFAKVGPAGENLLEFSLNQALLNNFNKIIFIVSKKTEKQFKEYFKNSYKGIPIFYALQEYDKNFRKKPWGTTDALCSAKHLIKDSLIVCNGDDIYGKKSFSILFNHLKKNKGNATIGYKLEKVLPEKGLVNRGIFREKNGFVQTVVETIGISKNNLEEKNLSKEDLSSLNIFALNKKTLDLLDKKLIKFKEINKNNSTIECYLPTELNNLISENKIKMELYPTEELWLGVTNPEDEIVVKGKLQELS
jgi:choline kinase